jgi:EAL and modified HD-GYP domain-containing signal transduction protein
VAASSTSSAQAAATVHVARQPIHDAAGRLFGYELLFRDTATAGTAGSADDSATTATILAAFSEFGGENLLGGRPGFINLTRAFLVGELPLPFSPAQAVLEVLETVDADDEVVAGVRRLAGEGYRLARDDITWRPGCEPLLEAADLVKVDVLALPWDVVLETLDACRPYGVTFLAEKVEDEAVLSRCADAGFELFQGFHLGRPETMSAETVLPALAPTLDLLARLGDPAASAAEIEDAVRRDPALSYRLLRIANSASSGVVRQVSSVRDALVLVGLAKLRAWLVLLSLDGGDGATGTEVTEALTRARTCELVARAAGTVRSDVAFTAGLLHGVAGAIGVPPPRMPERLPSLSPELAEALAGTPGPLTDVLEAVLAYQRGDVAALRRSGLPLSLLSDAYLAALAWTTETSRAAGDPAG